MRFKRMYSRPVNKGQGVKYDQIDKLVIYDSKKEYPDKLSRIKYYDKDNDKKFVFLTNNTILTAIETAKLNKKRWEVEQFFNCMKQHFLQIQSISLLDKTPIKNTLTSYGYKDIRELKSKHLIISGFSCHY